MPNLISKEGLGQAVRLAGAGLIAVTALAACSTPEASKKVAFVDTNDRSRITRMSERILLIGQQPFWQDTALSTSVQSGVQYLREKGCLVTRVSETLSGPAQIEISNPTDCLPELE